MANVIAYLPGFATNANYRYVIANTPGSLLSHLIYCFAGGVDTDSTALSTPEPNDDRANFPELLLIRSRFPKLRLILSLGGYAKSHFPDDPVGHPNTIKFSQIIASEHTRVVFVENCINRFIKHSPYFDGVDIDWENPGAADRSNFTSLINEFRSRLDSASIEMGKVLSLSVAIAAIGAGTGTDLVGMAHLVDWFGVRSYLLHRARQAPGETNFSAPLYAERPQDYGLSVSAAIEGIIALGIPPEKLILGINAVAESFGQVPDISGGVYQRYDGLGPGTFTPGKILYRDLVANYLPTCSPPTWNEVAKATGVYDPLHQAFISGQLLRDVDEKAAYVRDHGLAGIFLWHLGADRPVGSRLEVVARISDGINR